MPLPDKLDNFPSYPAVLQLPETDSLALGRIEQMIELI
jgi:hypothetical protein